MRPAPASKTASACAATCAGVPANAKRSRTSSGICASALSSSGSKETRRIELCNDAEIHRNLAPRDRTRTFTVFVDDGDCAEHDPHLVVSDALSHHRHDVRIRTPADLHLLGCRPGKCRELRRPGSHEQRHARPPALVTETRCLAAARNARRRTRSRRRQAGVRRSPRLRESQSPAPTDRRRGSRATRRARARGRRVRRSPRRASQIWPAISTG